MRVIVALSLLALSGCAEEMYAHHDTTHAPRSLLGLAPDAYGEAPRSRDAWWNAEQPMPSPAHVHTVCGSYGTNGSCENPRTVYVGHREPVLVGRHH